MVYGRSGKWIQGGGALSCRMMEEVSHESPYTVILADREQVEDNL